MPGVPGPAPGRFHEKMVATYKLNQNHVPTEKESILAHETVILKSFSIPGSRNRPCTYHAAVAQFALVEKAVDFSLSPSVRPSVRVDGPGGGGGVGSVRWDGRRRSAWDGRARAAGAAAALAMIACMLCMSFSTCATQRPLEWQILLGLSSIMLYCCTRLG